MAALLGKQLRSSVKASIRGSMAGYKGSQFSSATLDLRFALQKNLDPRITFTRASSATYIDSSGTLQTAATNVPRFDHNPSTRESLGLLVEEQRTNSIRNNTMVGAVAGTPGTAPTNWFLFTAVTGLTRTIVGTGTENGVTYIDLKVTGTPSAAGSYQFGFENQAVVSALTGQAWTQSVYLKLQSGSYAGISATRFGFNEFTSVPAFVTINYVAAAAATSAALSTQRQSGTQTLNGGATTAFVQSFMELTLTGAAIDITLRIGLPQLEQGAFATSVIPTTSAAATRSADVASITGAAFSSFYNQGEGTVYHQGRTPTAANFFSIDDGTVNNRITSYMTSATTPFFFVSTGGATIANLTSSAITAGSLFAQADAYKAADFAISTNGGTVSTSSSGAVPVVNKMVIGANVSGSAAVNGTIKRLTYWPQRLPNSALQAITQ